VKYQKGFAPFILIILIITITVGVVVFAKNNKHSKETAFTPTTQNNVL